MGDYTELKRLAEEATAGPWVSGGSLVSTAKGNSVADCPRGDESFIAAANPTAVLALIAENERLTGCIVKRRAQAEQYDQALIKMAAERDQLRAEVAGLKTGYEAYDRANAELKAEVGSLTKEADTQYTVIEKLKADNDRIERNRDMWKGQVERQAEELTALRGEVAEWKDTVKFNEKCWSEERGTMIDKLQESRMRIKEMDLLFGRYILAMRSAIIEEEHGKGPAAAMEWIYNSLAGPGELPPEGETESQAYFDREIIAVDNGMQEVMAFHEGRRAAMGQGERS